MEGVSYKDAILVSDCLSFVILKKKNKKNSCLNSFQSFKNGKAMFSASFIRRSDVSSFPLGDRGNDTSGQGQALLRCDNADGDGDDDDENSDVGNDFHCGSYDDSIDVWYHLG